MGTVDNHGVAPPAAGMAEQTMRFGLVLGAGGTVGLAYEAGVLKGLLDGAGLDAGSADLIVGTSAGSVVGAYLRSGWTVDDMWGFALGTHPSLAGLDVEALEVQRARILVSSLHNPVDVVRRGLGSAWVLGRSVVRLPQPPLPAAVRRMFPGGLFRMVEAERRFAEELPDLWPDRPLWLVAYDTVAGRRVVLGRPGSPEATLQQAVMASTAIPAVYPPVQLGPRVLVDGGAYSSTSLDLAAAAGCRTIIGVAPMAYGADTSPECGQKLVRRLPSRRLRAEVRAARRDGGQVLLLRPTTDELRLHGYNLMRRDRWEAIAVAAREATLAVLDTERFQDGLRALAV
jgi:NTE family protein